MNKMPKEELQKLVDQAEKNLTKSGNLKSATEWVMSEAKAQGYELEFKSTKKLIAKKCAEEVDRYCASMNDYMRG